MILVCPTCRTRYQVNDEAVGRPSGRTVRCANCGHSWHHRTRPLAPPTRRLREPARQPPDPVPLASVPRPAIIAPPPPRQKRRSGFAWVVVLLLFGGAIVGLILGRERVIALWPPAAQLYERVGLETELLGAGLDIVNVASTRNADGLIVEGDITNRAGSPRTVPHLRVALRDSGQKELVFKIVEPPRERLLPGETSHFVIGFLPAPDAAVGVLVTFSAG